MHMADAMLSPAVGGAMWAAAAGLGAFSAGKVRSDLDERKVPLMGVLGAFIFAAQMLNFSIPGTGSSGHLGGGLILAILIGPYAGFLTIASVLVIQALFFADGGLLALGCNVINLGFWPCFVAYSLLYKVIVRDRPTSGRIFFGALAAAIVGLQLGAFSVVLETLISGLTDIPCQTFVLLMQPIHLAIGIVEGLTTAAITTFVWRARPEILETSAHGRPYGPLDLKRILIGLGIMAAVAGGALSWFASTHPDGLEWSMFQANQKKPRPPAGIYESLARVQQKTAILPDYGFKTSQTAIADKDETKRSWPSVDGGTSVSGLAGAALTLALAALIGFVLRVFVKRRSPQ